jgi:hypothetical protein
MHAAAFPVTDRGTVYELPPRFRLLHLLAVRLPLVGPLANLDLLWFLATLHLLRRGFLATPDLSQFLATLHLLFGWTPLNGLLANALLCWLLDAAPFRRAGCVRTALDSWRRLALL